MSDQQIINLQDKHSQCLRNMRRIGDINNRRYKYWYKLSEKLDYKLWVEEYRYKMSFL